MKIDITGLGFCGYDYLCIVNEIPHDEKTGALEYKEQGGGPSATAIVTAAMLGSKTAMMSAIGNDKRGNDIINELKNYKILTNGICRKSGSSPTAFCWIEKKSARRSIVWHKGNIKSLIPRDIKKHQKLISASRVLHCDGHHLQAALFAADIAKKHGVKVSLDAGSLLPGIDNLIKKTDILIASCFFAQTWSKTENTREALYRLASQGSEIVIITSGEKGLIGRAYGKNFTFPAFRIKARDTTGAGDVFHGAFLHAYCRGWNIEKACRFASAASALNCLELGGRNIKSFDQVRKFLILKGIKL
ncbi:MAG: hypothetical protein A2096_09625 [Spirochaetes bacterium GWF1_41_5]|nr:MAG: hypothetical protein A2096_09625 [Spirochaetes bacterium GWF1_41_5]